MNTKPQTDSPEPSSTSESFRTFFQCGCAHQNCHGKFHFLNINFHFLCTVTQVVLFVSCLQTHSFSISPTLVNAKENAGWKEPLNTRVKWHTARFWILFSVKTLIFSFWFPFLYADLLLCALILMVRKTD